jgi:hypothetical protein
VPCGRCQLKENCFFCYHDSNECGLCHEYICDDCIGDDTEIHEYHNNTFTTVVTHSDYIPPSLYDHNENPVTLCRHCIDHNYHEREYYDLDIVEKPSNNNDDDDDDD